MGTTKVKQSKPHAVFGAVGGAIILVIGVAAFVAGDADYSPLVLVGWVAFGLAIIGFNLWSAFGKKGHIYVLDDGRPSPSS